MRRALVHLASAAIALPILALSFAACSIGQGNGDVTGVLNVRDCWSGPFDLRPNFFAAVPYRESLQLRIQNGGDFETFSDGVSILIDDVYAIRTHTDDAGATAGEIGVPLNVSLPPGVTPPGVPITPNPDPARVHLALYMQHTCRTQYVALYALEAVTLNANGTCDVLDGGEPPGCPTVSNGEAPPASSGADGGANGALDGGTDGGADGAVPTSPDGGAAPPAPPTPGANVGHSSITFQSLFNNDVEEARADNRLNEGSFKVYLGDPRELCPGGLGPPPPCRGYLEGTFKFYFERGRPSQPFP